MRDILCKKAFKKCVRRIERGLATRMAAVSTMSKKRYNDIFATLQHIVGDEAKVQQAMAEIRAIMKFDPECSRYTPELAKKEKERRHKLRDEHGISTYITSGMKKIREQKRQAI